MTHQEEHSDHRNLQILVVEDNMINQRLIMAALKRMGHQVECAMNGEIAVSKFQEKSYDAILMDIMMPVMDGVTACREIRKLEEDAGIPKEKRIKIIAVTANAFEDDRDRLLEAGMNDMMNKPIDIDELDRMLSA